MRLGFVGVGPWAQKLATAFRECGAEVVAYDRASRVEFGEPNTPPGFGSRIYWKTMVDPGNSIDAVIACAPPDVTTEVALACAKAEKRCVATKPLLWTEWPEAFFTSRSKAPIDLDAGMRITSYLYVDLWRLYSPAWIAMKEELRGKKIDRIDVAFCGNGPFRSFNGALDYGPHALAFVFDLLGTTVTDGLETDIIVDTRRDDAGHLYQAAVKFSCGGIPVELDIGNGAAEGKRFVNVQSDDGWHEFNEPDETQSYYAGPSYPIVVADVVSCSKTLALRRFCRAFMAGEASRTLEYSIAAQRVLERITQP